MFTWLEMAQVGRNQVKHAQERKKGLRLSLSMGRKLRKRKKWFWGLPAATFSIMDF